MKAAVVKRKCVARGQIHIMPLNDWAEHYDCVQCLCRPFLTRVGSEILVVHNAFDAREYFEGMPDDHPDGAIEVIQ